MRQSGNFAVVKFPCIVARVDGPAGAKDYAPVRLPLYSLQISGEVIVYSTEEHIRTLTAALEHDASLVEQATAERFIEPLNANWTKVERPVPSPGGFKKIEWHLRHGKIGFAARWVACRYSGLQLDLRRHTLAE
ncbi:hypothetical protein WL14_31190 [Burkholderia cepacia]|nr:hypothetical protein WL14_31190 [Burkholderia cepacia]